MQNISSISFRTVENLRKILKTRIKDLEFESSFSKKANMELALLQNNEFNDLLSFKRKLDISKIEVEQFLLSPKTPEIAKINGLPEKSDQLNKIVQWKNRLKNKINTPAIKHTWDYGIPAMAGLVAMASTYTFSTEEKSALGIGFLTTLSVGFLKDFIATQKQEALSDIKPKEEILPQVYFFLEDPNIKDSDKQKIQENLEHINPVEMTLLKDLSTSELKAFFTSNSQKQQDILNAHNFSKHSWKETAYAAIKFMSVVSFEEQVKISHRNLANNILTRRLERANLVKSNGFKM